MLDLSPKPGKPTTQSNSDASAHQQKGQGSVLTLANGLFKPPPQEVVQRTQANGKGNRNAQNHQCQASCFFAGRPGYFLKFRDNTTEVSYEAAKNRNSVDPRRISSST